VADLKPHVPKTIKDGLGDGFAPGGLLVRKDEQQIDVGAGGQEAAPIAAGRDHGHAFGFRSVLRLQQIPLRELKQHADDLVLHEGQPFGAAAAITVAQQQALGAGASCD
jgi:hypothetical protein